MKKSIDPASAFNGVGFTAAAVLAIPLLMGAQQQPTNPRAGWPCGGRLDPSYFQLSEATGGHMLMLAPEEIGDSAALLTAFGDHPQTILRLAGSMSPGLHEFQVPIDPSVESVLFSISVQCLQAADVMQPSGAFVGGHDVTDFSNFRAQRMVIVKQPEPGVWTIRVAGSGVSGLVVQAQSAIGIGRIEFAPAQDTTFRPVPWIGVENTMRIRMSGQVADLGASAVSGELLQFADLPLATGDIAESYMSRFTPGTEGFRVLVSGQGPEGHIFQRMTGALLTPMR